jgi:hypothetical protein
MSEVRVNNLSNESLSGGPTISGITTFSSPYLFTPPVGDTASRPSSCPPGSLRFNTDSAHLEYYRGDTIGWVEIEAELTEPLGGGSGSNSGLGTRAVLGSGEAPHGDTIDFLTISTFGDSTDFGNLTQDRRSGGAMGSSETRGLFAGGQHPSPFTFFNIIDFVTIASTGNATNFGDLENKAYNVSGMSTRTRGVAACGQKGPSFAAVNTIEYVTIASTGDAKDFGDLSTVRTLVAGAASSTRGLFAGGHDTTNVIDFITIASTGNANDFGDLQSGAARKGMLSCSNSTRALFAGGETPSNSNIIDFVTIATQGDGQNFGDLTFVTNTSSGTSSPTRGIFAGGSADTIDKVEILTTGDAVDFGNLGRGSSRCYGAFSSGHGGL